MPALAWHDDQGGGNPFLDCQRIVACDGLQRQHFQAEIANNAAHHIDTSRVEQRRLPEFVRGDAKQHRNYGRAADQGPTPQESTAVV